MLKFETQDSHEASLFQPGLAQAGSIIDTVLGLTPLLGQSGILARLIVKSAPKGVVFAFLCIIDTAAWCLRTWPVGAVMA